MIFDDVTLHQILRKCYSKLQYSNWCLSHRSMGLIPGHDTCVHGQDASLSELLFTQGYKWVPVRAKMVFVIGCLVRYILGSTGCILPKELAEVV